eukprot:SAG22_NODE_716_length_7715_cov_6.435399_2_plen_251_part_00
MPAVRRRELRGAGLDELRRVCGLADTDGDPATPCVDPDEPDAEAEEEEGQVFAIPKVAVVALETNASALAGYVALQLSVELVGTARNLYAVRSGGADRPLVLPAAYHAAAPFGAHIAGTDPRLLAFGPEAARYDSYLTIGPTGGLVTGAEISSFGVAFDSWTNSSGAVSWTNSSALTAPDGGLFWMNPDSGPDRAGGDIAVGQLTVPSDTVAGFSLEMTQHGRSIFDRRVDAETRLATGDWEQTVRFVAP